MRARSGPPGTREEEPAHHGRERRGRRNLGRLVERRHGERRPEPRARKRRLAGGGERLGHGPRGIARGAQEPQRPYEHPEPVAAGKEPVAEQRRRRLERARHRRRSDRPPAVRRIGHRHVEARLDGELRRGADLGEEVERLGVRAGEHVRAVVHLVAGVRIFERVRTPAEEGPRFEERHAHARARKPHGRGEPREPAAHDHDVAHASRERKRRCGRTHAAIASPACSGRVSRTFGPKTS